MNKLVIGIDVGTTNTKANIIDIDGKILASASKGYGILTPHTGWVEQDAEMLFDAVMETVKNAVSLIGDRNNEISAIALSTQRDTLVCVDENNIPIRNAITWMDGRSSLVCEKLKNDLGEEYVYNATGVNISIIWTLAFILWLRENEKENFDKTKCFALVEDFLLKSLGADEHIISYSSACQTMLFNIHEKCWDKRLLEYSGLEEDRLPKLDFGGKIAGTVSNEIAEKLGIPADTLLVLGGGDQQCAALGAGAVKDGDLMMSIGTASNLLAASKTIQLDKNCKVLLHYAANEENYVCETALLATGATVEWLKNELYKDCNGGEFFSVLNAEVEASVPGSNGLILTPHFEGAGNPYWDNELRGILLGLKLSTKRGDIARSVMEGISFELKKNVDMLTDMGVNIERIIVTGGAGKSKAWMQILADILGKRVYIPKTSESATMGAGRLAFKALGIDGFMSKTSDFTIYEPNGAEIYKTIYDINKKAVETLINSGVMSELYNATKN